VIDTCGDRGNKNPFELDFSGWKRVEIWPNLNRDDIEGYCAWSLRNVLLRKQPHGDDNFNLNPETAGTETCISVHKKKYQALFQGKGMMKKWKFDKATVASLKDDADQYAAKITKLTEMPIDV
jgi:hypothetical protein